ncbi:MAG: hypothetical protein ABR587_13480 [Candidatus Binatia bacterium]
MPRMFPVSTAVLVLLAVPGAASSDELPRNWPMAPSELEMRFAQQPFKILEVKSAGAGVTGASKLEIEYPDKTVLKVKWKAVPPKSADGWNNSPRKEMATYAIQRWFVDENDYMVPTIAPHCLDLETAKTINSGAKPNVKGAACELGILAVWMEDVTVPDSIYDEKRFASDPLYARYMADFNLLGYLVDHRDGRKGNVLLSTDAADPRVYAVDNGIAFDPFPWNFLVPNWNKIRVPWLRRESIERLRKIDEDQFKDLGVLVELEADEHGRFRMVPPGRNIDDDKGVRVRGNRMQFGLTDDEIEDLEDRVEDLLDDVDSGKQAVR